MDRKDLPIGFYDSGVGGISVLKQTVKMLPHENFIYFGDTANAPYGIKDEKTIRALSIACGDFLFAKGVKAIVIACNTATSIVVQTMREKYNIPVISIEPAVKPAAEKYASGDIIVLATPATIRQERYGRLLARLEVKARVINVACDGLAGLIERGDLSSPHIKAYIYEKLAPLRDKENVCAVVMGCTHYSFVSHQIHDVAQKLLKGSCEIFDGMYGTARHVADVLKKEGIQTARTQKGEVHFYTSGEQQSLQVLSTFFQL